MLRGDTEQMQAMLFAQANALQGIFVELARRATSQEYLRQWETYIRVALKAQNQCRATLDTLANMKNPPRVYATNANIAHGPQQVNVVSGATAPGISKDSAQTELLEAQHGERLDFGATGETGRGDSTMASMGAIDGAAN